MHDAENKREGHRHHEVDGQSDEAGIDQDGYAPSPK
jgi:hypothetical protein